MELPTITQVSKHFNISTRTLRYYEQIGLITSVKKEGFAYRSYNTETFLRLKQIVLLRKLRIPLKQIGEILKNEDVITAINSFEQNLKEIDGEITALSTIKGILTSSLERLQLHSDLLKLLDDERLYEIIDSLTASKTYFKEEKSMKGLNKANEILSYLKDVRILHLPPCTVASSHCFGKVNAEAGENPESKAANQLMEFILKNDLYRIKPDARVFGFNHPNPSEGKEDYGYEFWVSIPDDLEVPESLQKKHLDGGLYAAHMIQMGNFHEWEWLTKWVETNRQYTANYSNQGEEIMGGCLEEHLNFVYNVCVAKLKWFHNETQIDLLTPIKIK